MEDIDQLLGTNSQQNNNEENMVNADIETLIRIIYQEKSCPYLIPYQQNIIQPIMENCANQEQSIQDLENNIEQTKKTQQNNVQIKQNFLLQLYTFEIQRIKYLTKLYLKIRLQKLTKYAFYYQQSAPLNPQLLSPSEKSLLNSYTSMKKERLKEVIKNLPQKHQSLDEHGDSNSSQQNQKKNNNRFENIGNKAPEASKFVFGVFTQVPNTEIEYGVSYNNNSQQSNIEKRKQEIGDIILASYQDIKALHEVGTIELI